MGSVLSVEDKGQEGHVAQVNLSAAQLAAETLQKFGMSQRVEVRFSCKGLPRKDIASKSDPMVVLFTSAATGQTEWKELGRTNMVANTANPEFVRPVLAKFDAGGTQPMRLVVYDVDHRFKKIETLSLDSQDYIAEAEFLMSELMGAPGATLELPLLDLASGRTLPPTCTVTLKADALAAQDNRVVRLALSANGLPKKDLASQSDPFVRGLKRRPAGGMDDWVPTFKTEVRDNNSDPLWQPIEVDIRQLCNGDEALPMRLQVFDYDSNGNHALLGEATTTLSELKALAAAPPMQRRLPLQPPAVVNGKAPPPPGSLVLRQLMVRDGPTPSQRLFGCCNACTTSDE